MLSKAQTLSWTILFNKISDFMAVRTLYFLRKSAPYRFIPCDNDNPPNSNGEQPGC
jgi:hypothetical protein